MDPRIEKLADLLTGYSVSLKKGEKVLIDAFDVPDSMVIALIRAARARKAIPYVSIKHARITRELYRNATEAQFTFGSDIELNRMKGMDAYIALRGANNIFELSDVPPGDLKRVMKLTKPVLDWRVNKTKWVVLRWPTSAMAQQAMTSTEDFEDFFFNVCTLDYEGMVPAMKALKRLMDNTDQVRIKGPGETDLRFSIKGIGSVICGGKHNIPDGEVFSCPIRDSVNGVLQYNTASVYQGNNYNDVRFVFKNGKIVKESAASNNGKLKKILDSDDGARHIGEFAIGFNPYILEPMMDTLFDEKIAGSFHFTPGQAYEETDNGNRSQIHWDLVCIQRPEYGGGEIWFDGKLIRKDGLFLPKTLQKLNPEALLKQD